MWEFQTHYQIQLTTLEEASAPSSPQLPRANQGRHFEVFTLVTLLLIAADFSAQLTSTNCPSEAKISFLWFGLLTTTGKFSGPTKQKICVLLSKYHWNGADWVFQGFSDFPLKDHKSGLQHLCFSQHSYPPILPQCSVYSSKLTIFQITQPGLSELCYDKHHDQGKSEEEKTYFSL